MTDTIPPRNDLKLPFAKYCLLLGLICLLWACERDQVEDLDGEYRELLLLQQADSSRRFEGGVRFGFPDGGAWGSSLPLELKLIPSADCNTMQIQHTPTQTTVFSATIYTYGLGQREIPAVLDSAGAFIRQTTIPEIDPHTVTWLSPAPDTTGYKLLTLWSKIDDLNLVARFMAVPHQVAIFHYTPSVGQLSGDIGKYYWIFYR